MPSSRRTARLPALACAAVILAPVAEGSLCGIVDHRTAIVDNRLFFTSGNYTFADNKIWHNTSDLYWLDLTKSFDVDGMLDSTALNQSALPSGELASSKRLTAGGAAGVFFYDHTTMYAYGGLIEEDADGVDNSLWAYNTTTDTWNLTSMASGSISFGDNTEGIYASDPDSGRSFYTGGWEVSFNGSNKGMVKFTTNNSATPTFDFDGSQTNDQGLSTLKGAMVYTRKGKQGTLISFGGDDTTSGGVFNGEQYWNQRSMAKIFIYDIDSETWYNTTASGDIPGPRTEFCAAVSAAPDDSSFQITIHGGWDQGNAASLNDVYVLSIPAFEWIKVNATGDPDATADRFAGRHRHKCNVWNDRQMLVTGGVVDANGTSRNDYCNATSHPPVKVLDLSTYKWQTAFQPNLSYTIPTIVRDVIGGDASGSAAQTSPTAGWNNTALSAIFANTVPRSTYTPPSDSLASDDEEDASTHTGAIVGGVVGGVGGFSLLATAALLFVRHRRQQQQATTRTDSGPVELVGSSGSENTGPASAQEVHGADAKFEMNGQGVVAEKEAEGFRCELEDTGVVSPVSAGVVSPLEEEVVGKSGGVVGVSWGRRGGGDGGGGERADGDRRMS